MVDTNDSIDDYVAITELRSRYSRAIDEFNLDEYSALFTADAVVDYSGVVLEGREEIVEFVRDNVEYEFCMHTAQMPQIDIDGESAFGSWYLFVPYVAIDGTEGIVMGRYDDTYRQVDGEWKFARITTRIHHDTGGYHTS